MENENRKTNVLELSNELTVRRYLFNKEHVNNILSIPDYIALHIIKETEHLETIYAGRTYLKDLAEKMQLSIHQTSRMVGSLRERGLVSWSHDGDGSKGTYVTITESGEKIYEQQQNILKEYYGKVISKYGEDKFIQLLHLMKELETVMHNEIEGMEVSKEDDGAIE